MKKIVYLNESQLKNIIEKVIQESKKDDKLSQIEESLEEIAEDVKKNLTTIF